MHIYLQERVEIAPGQVQRYLAQVEAGWSNAERLGPRCMGVWYTAGVTGRWHEVYFLWEFDDWAHYGRVIPIHRDAGPAALVSWADPDWQLRTGGDSLTMEPDSRSPSLANLVESGVRGGLFMHEYIRVAPGKRQAYIDHYLENFLPATRKAGRELVGIWSLMSCANDVLILLAMKDWEGYAAGMAGRQPDIQRVRWQESAPLLRHDYDLRLLVPGPRAMNPLAA
ncbi:MAG: hypothetical protein V3V35_02255 [Dehalococcoidia bacterium]